MKKITIFLIAFSLAGCEVAKTPVPTGGSKSDALVELSFDVGELEVPVVDWQAAGVSAVKRCNAWGYRKADPFEGTRTQCLASDMYGSCTRSTITRTYQCTN